MDSNSHVRIVTLEAHGAWSADPEQEKTASLSSAGPVRRAIRLTRQWLLSRQEPDGHWCGELEADSSLQSETILLLAFLGREQTPLADQAAEQLIQTQASDGAWAAFPGGPPDLNATIKAYFALKLAGHAPSREYMGRAQRAVLAAGGADAADAFTRFYLAILDQIPYDCCPALPPEAMLLPGWLPINLYRIAVSSRALFVPLSIVSALRPVRQISVNRGVRELFVKSPNQWPPLPIGRFWRAADLTAKWLQRRRWTPLRAKAIEHAKNWILERFRGSDGPAAHFTSIAWSWIALQALGYAEASPEIRHCENQLHELAIVDEGENAARVQPCHSPVADTAITVRALAESGLDATSHAVGRAVNWLLDRQVLQPGDWSKTVNALPGGWAFEYANDFYPDTDDTAMALMALESPFAAQPASDVLPPELRLVAEAAVAREQVKHHVAMIDRAAGAIRRGQDWLLAMQNRDGGWGLFDRDNDRGFLQGLSADPSSPDLTGRVLEALGRFGRRQDDLAVRRAVDFLRRAQQPDGSWLARRGVGFIYGTWQSLVGLVAAGVAADDPAVEAGTAWLQAHQQPCGGWGETPECFDNPTARGQGRPTASQTAWAVMGLLAAGQKDHPATARGVRFLIENQREDGSWDETERTGVALSGHSYWRHDFYRVYFPLMALARWAAANRSSP